MERGEPQMEQIDGCGTSDDVETGWRHGWGDAGAPVMPGTCLAMLLLVSNDVAERQHAEGQWEIPLYPAWSVD